ncbi:MAG TPA: hypothetical protein VK480_05900 [Solirubrobacterales bacterium]|nr:hypothetical protein [Solirubrobacterales bacterium]
MPEGAGGEAPLCVVYLAWTPYGIERAESFLASYRAHEAGAPHRLLLLLAGPEEEDRSPWHELFAAVPHEVLEVGLGMDLGHYRAAVDRVTAERYCFLNTVTTVLVDDWLGRMERALLAPGVGMVGATGSYESPNAVRPGPLRRLRPGFESFPNPHLRTNGFAMERELILQLDWSSDLTREETVMLEGSRRSLTRQVRERGLETLVVGRDGTYPPERWRESATFRSGEQANLLLADNRTRHYQDAGRISRFGLAWLAWHTYRG